MSIYLPDALARAVRAAGISVSPVCQRALEQEVARGAARRAVDAGAVRAAAARMRPDRVQSEQDDLVKGYRTGERWALEFARPDRLEDMEEWFRQGWPDNTVVEHVPVDDTSVVASLELRHDDLWCQGFVEGAIDAWDQIAAALESTTEAGSSSG